jgi:hypothetical protein
MERQKGRTLFAPYWPPAGGFYQTVRQHTALLTEATVRGAPLLQLGEMRNHKGTQRGKESDVQSPHAVTLLICSR